MSLQAKKSKSFTTKDTKNTKEKSFISWDQLKCYNMSKLKHDEPFRYF